MRLIVGDESCIMLAVEDEILYKVGIMASQRPDNLSSLTGYEIYGIGESSAHKIITIRVFVD